MLSTDGWVTRAAEAPGGSASQTHCPEGGAPCYWRDLYLHLHHLFASTSRLLLDTVLQVQYYSDAQIHTWNKASYTFQVTKGSLLHPAQNSPKTQMHLMPNQWFVDMPHMPLRCPLPLHPLLSRALVDFSSSQANRTVLLVCQGDWKHTTMSGNLTCYITLQWPPICHSYIHCHLRTHPHTHTHSNLTLLRHRGKGNCYLSWVGVCWKMCFSYSLSHQPQ